jgi:hypothetical protein
MAYGQEFAIAAAATIAKTHCVATEVRKFPYLNRMVCSSGDGAQIEKPG